MKLALLTKYGNMAASTRQRFEQYRPFLEDAGFELVSYPLLDNNYLSRLYNNQRQERGHVTSCYLKRFRWLLSKPDVDLIWLHCELFPFFPGLAEKFSTWPGKPIVFDYDDAIFHNYNIHPKPLVRATRGRKLHTTIRAAEMAFCGNDYLANYARPLCSRTEIVPTILDTSIFCPAKNKQSMNIPPRIGWIGSPSTWNDYLLSMLPILQDLTKSEGAKIAIMGADKNAEPNPLIDFEEWSEASEVPFLQSLDIGIMPLVDTPWARGKCGYKLIQYMACGLPVVASPVGVNSDIVEHGVNGFLAETNEEWSRAIKILLNNADLRRQMGSAGQKKVEEYYSLKVWGPRVAQMLQNIIKEQAKG